LKFFSSAGPWETAISPVHTYLAALSKAWARGDATEHTHRAALQKLFENSVSGLEATNEPKASQPENKPDFLLRKSNSPIGYAEAKDLGVALPAVLRSPQIRRYQEALPNLLVTNYLDFVWLVGPDKRMEISLGRLRPKGIEPSPSAQADWDTLIASFCAEISPTLGTPHQLAACLAGQTRLLRDLVAELLQGGDEALHAQYAAFKSLLMPDLLADDFADMYAQTAAYGLFTARVFDHTSLYGAPAHKLPAGLRKAAFSLEKAAHLIPRANPFLRQFFQHVSSPDLSEQLRWLVEQIAGSLHYTDMDKVLHRQSRKAGFEDPVFHFYETFLAAYDQALRAARGVYYTPQPVVDFIVRGVDRLLQTQLGRPEGLADPGTLILDPATGTATFLRRVIEHIHARVTAGGNLGLWPQYVHERLLPRVFGFELMMAPYTVAHLKIALLLQEQGYRFGDKKAKTPAAGAERLNIFLTNTLDSIRAQSDAFLANWIATESQGAEAVKRDAPVQVIVGNPPYSGESTNKSAWIRELMDDYKKEPEGGPLKERNSKWINDDYVKFIRFAQDRIARTGFGVLAFITNHGWLDNPTFRGMRASLMRDFDTIYVLDLHGNAKKQERTPAALAAQGDDKNVFDIEQGVAIVFMVKRAAPAAGEGATAAPLQNTLHLFGDPLPAPARSNLPRKAQVLHAQIWGQREHKYGWLHSHALDQVPWQTLSPKVPLLLFVPRNETAAPDYERGWKVTDIFPVNGTGIVTKCDQLNIHFSADGSWEAINWFLQATELEARKRFRLPGPMVRDWSIASAQDDIRTSGPSKSLVQTVAYRPFDTRFVYYTGKSRGLMGWPVQKIMGHLQTKGERIFLGTCRQMNGNEWVHAMVGVGLAESCCISNKTSEIGSVFPLWLHPQAQPSRPHLAPQVLQAQAASQGVPSEPERHDLPQGVQPEQVLAFVYAVLHGPGYRSAYAEFLKSDFPRIPLACLPGTAPRFAALWKALLPLGQALIDAHLLRKVPAALRARFPVAGDNLVDKPRFAPGPEGAPGRVYINANQYFDGVPASTWAFKVGGYQVCEKWLKDRKGRTLSLQDLEHYSRTVAALTHTRALMAQIEAVAGGSLWPHA